MKRTYFDATGMRVDVKHNDRGRYQATIRDQGKKQRISVGEPRYLSRAVDSRTAMRDAATAALAFADDSGIDLHVPRGVHGMGNMHRPDDMAGGMQVGPRGGKYIIGNNGKKYYPVKGRK